MNCVILSQKDDIGPEVEKELAVISHSEEYKAIVNQLIPLAG